jgi:hypothetical protein
MEKVMNDVIELPRRESAGIVAGETHRYSAMEIRERVNLVQEVMRAVMKEGVHYGTIPGTPKPTLYKPGAEVLCVAFRIAPSYTIEDLGNEHTARYRLTCHGTHQTSGIALGDGVGECSSAEEKYKWRGAVTAEEFEYFPESMRRLKFYKNGTKGTQVRTEAADLSNTILKMASKRAHIAMTLAVTGASDMFTQDIEDLPEELRHQEAGEPVMSELALKWLAEANKATTAEELTAIWTSGVKEINAAKDVSAQNAFKAAVAAKGAALKAAAAPAAPIPPELEDLVADMQAAADDGAEAFDASWNSLSKTTRDKIEAVPGLFAALHARAQKSGGAK